MSDETSLKLLRQSYNLAKKVKGEDRLTARDVAEAKKVVKTRMKYEIAEQNKSGDRLTKRDVEVAEESLPKFSTGKDVKSKLKKAVGMGAALLASNYVGKRAGEADATLNAAKRISGIGEFEEPSAFGFSIKPESRIKSTLNLSSGGDVVVGKGGDYIKDLID